MESTTLGRNMRLCVVDAQARIAWHVHLHTKHTSGIERAALLVFGFGGRNFDPSQTDQAGAMDRTTKGMARKCSYRRVHMEKLRHVHRPVLYVLPGP